MITYIRWDFQNIQNIIMYRIAYYNRVRQRTAVFRNSRGLFTQNIILTGDLNSDLFTSHSNKLIDTMDLFNLTNVIEKPTRVTEYSSTLLDPIIISDSIHYYFSDVLKVPSDISDHDA
jgi:hypothetical protein